MQIGTQFKTKTVCILAAGTGTRMGHYAGVTHKALLPLNNSAVLSHLIEKFRNRIGTSAHFVIAVGFQSRKVIDYIELAHPELSVEFVQVETFEGRGSGPGTSALACQDRLTDSFYLTCCDTLWDEIDCPVSLKNQNWIAVAQVSEEISADYCNAQIRDSEVISFCDKQRVEGSDFQAFTGLAHIVSVKPFFKSLEQSRNAAGSLELALGFSGLLSKNGGAGLFACHMKGWKDLGTLDRYAQQRKESCSTEFTKFGEFYYHVNNRVVKFFSDSLMASQRVRRAEILGSVIPPLVAWRDHFFAYDFKQGINFYQAVSDVTLRQLLHWLQENLWHEIEVSEAEKHERGMRFYFEKTLQRVESFYATEGRGVLSREKSSLRNLLSRVPWNLLAQVRPVLFHGDLQLGNILHHPDRCGFTLLDWRQDFAGSLTWGDLYYDVAKLFASIDLDFRNIQNPGSIRKAPFIRAVIEDFATKKGLDQNRIEILIALIYLNMSGINTSPSNRILYEEGHRRLGSVLETRAVGKSSPTVFTVETDRG